MAGSTGVDTTNIYILVGLFVLANLGTIITVLITSAKVIWWASKVESRITKAEADISASHDKHRAFIKTHRELHDRVTIIEASQGS